ncbi:MAG: HprK-related kinase B [Rhodospirillales bacterium]|nr:HprK-related kinase B [Rhodospirillales bacterium]
MSNPDTRMMSKDIAAQLAEGVSLQPGSLLLGLPEMTIRLRSNSTALLEKLRAYFKHTVIDSGDATVEIHAFDCAPPDLGLHYTDWLREAGKTGRKDAVFDLSDGRVVKKVRTGMMFLQSFDHRIAAGPCLENDNQVINFINAQYMSMLQHNGWSICHAAGLVRNGMALGLAGFSGGGKSTLMLHMLNESGTAFLSNDRLFVRRTDDGVMAAGIPKLPRINPGTALNNPRLGDIVTPERRDELAALPLAELWDIEEKYDVDIEKTYGPDRIAARAPLCGFVILNWSHSADDPTRITEVDLNDRRDLLAAVMKSPGPFYQLADGSMHAGNSVLDEESYLSTFQNVPVYEVTGRVDFDQIAKHCLDRLFNKGPQAS